MHMIIQTVCLRDAISLAAYLNELSVCVSKVEPPKLIKRNHLPFASENVTYDRNAQLLSKAMQCVFACQDAVIVSCLQACFAVII